MKNEGFKPPIYGLQPLKMEVLGSHGRNTIHGAQGFIVLTPMLHVHVRFTAGVSLQIHQDLAGVT